MKKIEGVIFDMDGVLFDTERVSLDIYKKIFKKYGYVIKEEVYAYTIGRARADVWNLYMDNYGDDLPLDKIFLEKDKEMLEYINKNGAPIKTGAYELLNYLNERGYKTALATSTYRKRAEELLQSAGIMDKFTATVCGDEVEKSKPNPEIFLKAANKLGLEPKKCIVLEDSPAGIEAANKAGMKGINIPDLKKPDGEIKKSAYKICSSLITVMDYLKSTEP